MQQVHTEEDCSIITEEKTLTLATKGMNLENRTLRERNQSQKTTRGMIPFT